MNETPPVALAYIRVSTDRQDLSTDTQGEQVKRAADYHQLALEVFPESDTSGSIPFAEREQGRALLARIDQLNQLALPSTRNPQPAPAPAITVIVPKVDRLGRDTVDVSSTVKHFDELGVRVMFLDINVDTRSALGRAFMQIAAVFAELERSRIRERITEAFATKRTRNEHLGGATAPYGWDKVATGRITAKDVATHELAANPTEQRHLLNMHAMQAAGLTYYTIAKQLNQMGVPTKRGRQLLKLRGKQVNGRETAEDKWTSGKWNGGLVKSILENATVTAWLAAQSKQQAA